jgi:hypothetical protein
MKIPESQSTQELLLSDWKINGHLAQQIPLFAYIIQPF